MAEDSKTYAERYDMRSRFYQSLGAIGKMMADAYAFDADLENRAALKELAHDAMIHSLIEHHGYKPVDFE